MKYNVTRDSDKDGNNKKIKRERKIEREGSGKVQLFCSNCVFSKLCIATLKCLSKTYKGRLEKRVKASALLSESKKYKT